MNQTATPYSRIGGEPAVRRLVARFYELMDTLPEAYGIRQQHQADLSSAAENEVSVEANAGFIGVKRSGRN